MRYRPEPGMSSDVTLRFKIRGSIKEPRIAFLW